MTKTIETTKRRGLTGRSTLSLDKTKRGTDIVVVNRGAYGERRQITVNLSGHQRQQLIEVLLEHHEQDML